MKTISVVSPCFNEAGNVRELYERVRAVIASLGSYHYEHIFIDNASSDGTVEVLKRLAVQDQNVKIIVNSRNFGHIRSPVHALRQARGNAVISMAADLQDPPELIHAFVREWEKGTPIVIAVKRSSSEGGLMFAIRRTYYRLVRKLSDIETFENFTGFGLYDRKVIEILRALNDPYPYFRGMIAEIGLPHAEIPFHQERRNRGITKNNLYSLYDLAMLGITTLSKVPLRIVTFTGFVSALICVLISFFYFVYKLVFWQNFQVGMAPLVIGIFFLGSVQLMFLGIIGEYIGNIQTIAMGRPLVFERERINFEFEPGLPLASDVVDEHSVGCPNVKSSRPSCRP